MGLTLALLADVSGVVVFAAIGRRSHDEADGIGAVLETAAPFLVALALGWLVVVAWGRSRSRRSDPAGFGGGLAIWGVTVVLGMLLRRTLWDRGTALAFVIVATLFIGFVLVGWRVGYVRLRRGPSLRS